MTYVRHKANVQKLLPLALKGEGSSMFLDMFSPAVGGLPARVAMRGKV